MKTRMTKKFVKQFCGTIIEIGYCGAWHLLQGIEPDWYTCGVYGWNADVYYLGDHTAIVTGYRPFGTVHPKYDVVKAFEQRAEEICNQYNFGDYAEKRKKLEELREEFVATVTA